MAQPKILLDPAYQKLAAMQKHRYKYFRWTPATVRFNIMALIVVPAILTYAAVKTDGLISVEGKRRGDTIFER